MCIQQVLRTVLFAAAAMMASQGVAKDLRSPNPNWQCEKQGDTWQCREKDQVEPGIRGAPNPYRLSNRDPFDPNQFDAGALDDSLYAEDEPDDAYTTEVEAGFGRRSAPYQEQSNIITVRQSELPVYVQLSYQPDAPTPLNKLPGAYWTVQLTAKSNLGWLENFVTENNLLGLIGAPLIEEDRMVYVLLLGIYETRNRAELAAASMPSALNQFEPWIRPISELQRKLPGAGQQTVADNGIETTRTRSSE